MKTTTKLTQRSSVCTSLSQSCSWKINTNPFEIRSEEALNVMGMNINAEEAKAMVSVADTSNDKHVSFPQFLNICTYIDHHLIEVDEQSRKK